jgi:hypothetical protein
MGKLISVLAIVSAIAPLAIAQKGTGALEGTVVDQDGRPLRSCGCVIVKRGSDAVPSSRNITQWNLRTDKMGHFFFKSFPTGAYSVTVIGRDGRIVKEIPSVRVEAGIVQNIDSVLGVVVQPDSPPAKTTSKQPPPPTQPDIVRGCISVHNIHIQYQMFWNWNVSASISNDCARDAYVSIEIEVFDANGSQIGRGTLERRAPVGTTSFRSTPDLADAQRVATWGRVGRITNISVQLQP